MKTHQLELRTSNEAFESAIHALRAERFDSIIYNVRSILQVVSGHAQNLGKHHPDRERANRLVNAMNNISNLVEQLASPEEKGGVLEDILMDTAKRYNALSAGDQRLEVVATGTGPYVDADCALRLQAVLLTLLDDAAMRRLDRVNIRLSPKAPHMTSRDLKSQAIAALCADPDSRSGLRIGNGPVLSISVEAARIL